MDGDSKTSVTTVAKSFHILLRQYKSRTADCKPLKIEKPLLLRSPTFKMIGILRYIFYVGTIIYFK